MECKETRDVSQFPRGEEWQYEVKLDGYRCIAIKQNNEVRLYSRTGKLFAQFPNLFEPLRTQRPKSFILDGEVMALDADGHSNFNTLQNWGRKPVDVHFYGFDLLHLNGRDLLNLPLHERQALIRAQFVNRDCIHFPSPLHASLDLVLKKIAEFGFEGIVAKRKDSIYTPGKRPGFWVKTKLKQTDEFIIGGFIPSGNTVDEIVVGKPVGNNLIYVASLDDGFVPATRRQVFDVVRKLKASECPFVNLPERKGTHRMDTEKMRKVVWVKPHAVVEIAMNEWTSDGHLRHGEFRRLRLDKSVKQVSAFPA